MLTGAMSKLAVMRTADNEPHEAAAWELAGEHALKNGKRLLSTVLIDF